MITVIAALILVGIILGWLIAHCATGLAHPPRPEREYEQSPVQFRHGVATYDDSLGGEDR